MGVSGQRHAPAALYPRYPLNRRLGGLRAVQTQGLEEKSSVSAGDRTPIVQPIVRHYTAWATAEVTGWILFWYITQGETKVLSYRIRIFNAFPMRTITKRNDFHRNNFLARYNVKAGSSILGFYNAVFTEHYIYQLCDMFEGLYSVVFFKE
jgi:hypothetical protein